MSFKELIVTSSFLGEGCGTRGVDLSNRLSTDSARRKSICKSMEKFGNDGRPLMDASVVRNNAVATI